jgi:hypothetical protein
MPLLSSQLPRTSIRELNLRLPLQPSVDPSPNHQAALANSASDMRRQLFRVGRLALQARSTSSAELRRYFMFVAQIELTRAQALWDAISPAPRPATSAGRPGEGELSAQMLWDGARLHGLDIAELSETYTDDGEVRMVVAQCVERSTGRHYQLTAAALPEGGA